MHPAASSLRALSVHAGVARETSRALPTETAVAMVYNGTTHAVMMASPSDLADFAAGFSLTEHIIGHPDEIESLEVVQQEKGMELRMWLTGNRSAALKERRRFMAGPVGCGLCGIDSLEEAVRPVAPITAKGLILTPADVEAAVTAISKSQPLHDRTRAVHAAAFYRPEHGILAAREDVGRHNALDKLVGALALDGMDASTGVIVLTSRISVEMVQKSACARVPVIVAVSAPTSHAVQLAEAAGMTLIGLARGGSFEIFCRPDRIISQGRSNVA